MDKNKNFLCPVCDSVCTHMNNKIFYCIDCNLNFDIKGRSIDYEDEKYRT